MREEARVWWETSERDLQTAEHSLAALDFYAAAFFSHQAAEKALKALWIETRRELAPKTHCLTDLASGLGSPEAILHHCRALNPAYLTTRYPDAANGVPADQFDRLIAADHVGRAKEVRAWAGSVLTRP